MKQTARLHVGSVEEMGKRFADAWRRLERGEKVRETHLTFFDLETMKATLSPKRLALLKHVRRHPAGSVAELAKTLGRDYKRVHSDVSAGNACPQITYYRCFAFQSRNSDRRKR